MKNSIGINFHQGGKWENGIFYLKNTPVQFIE